MEKIIEKTINDIGVPQKLLGYRYLEDAVSMALEEDDVYGTLTKSIYPSIAKKYNKRPSSIERNIRTAINYGWHNGDRTTFRKVFSSSGIVFKRAPTALELIAAMKTYVLDKSQSSIFSESGISSEGFSNEMSQTDETGME